MIPRDVGINAITNPFPSRSEKPTKTPLTTEMPEKIYVMISDTRFLNHEQIKAINPEP
jgi:hypothetical protein